MFTISPNYFRDRLPHPGTVDTVLLYYQYHIAVVTVPYLGTHNDSIDRLVKVTDIASSMLGVKNNAPLPQSGKAGGQMSHSYTYDPLYRLSSATGTYKGTDNKMASYTLAMGYDNMYRITSKKQHLTQSNIQFNGSLNAGYDLTYTYGNSEGKKFQLDNVRDINYRTEEAPTDSTNINNGHKYEYDLNGNLVYINTSRVKHDGKEDEKAAEQKYRWDEENRLLAADENGFVSNYWYDADGERTVKTSGENEAIFVNSEFSGGNTGTARFSLYVSPYLVAGQGGKYTKHIYIGSQRIVSKLGDLASYGGDPRRIPYAGNEADGVTVNYKDKYYQQLQSIKDNYKTFDLPYNGQDNPDYVNGKGFSSDDDTPEAAQARAMVKTRAGEAGTNERMQFYYHPDHLGSSSYITNLDGEVAQHIEYVPFGEVFIEERNNTWNTPYLFNAKEFDEETGMYYYGARYYEPRLSLWMSTDADEEKYPFYSTYCYATNNPIKFIDPNGKAVRPNGALAMSIILNTLPIDARQYITIDKTGYLDLNVMKQYKGNSENFNSLKTLVKSDYDIQVTTLDKTRYVSNGKTNIEKFMPVEVLEDFKDTEFTSSIGNTTGETGNLGVTYMPNNGGSDKADADNPNSIHININPSLSSTGAAETFSHEGYGHALIFVESGGDRKRAVHHFSGSHDTNLELVEKSISARKETVKNMEQ